MNHWRTGILIFVAVSWFPNEQLNNGTGFALRIPLLYGSFPVASFMAAVAPALDLWETLRFIALLCYPSPSAADRPLTNRSTGTKKVLNLREFFLTALTLRDS